VNGEQQ